jgi:hypothetical protein
MPRTHSRNPAAGPLASIQLPLFFSSSGGQGPAWATAALQGLGAVFEQRSAAERRDAGREAPVSSSSSSGSSSGASRLRRHLARHVVTADNLKGALLGLGALGAGAVFSAGALLSPTVGHPAAVRGGGGQGGGAAAEQGAPSPATCVSPSVRVPSGACRQCPQPASASDVHPHQPASANARPVCDHRGRGAATTTRWSGHATASPACPTSPSEHTR